MNNDFFEKIAKLEQEQEQLLQRPNETAEGGNGVFERYKNPVLTAAHTPFNWRYDLNAETNPFLLERFGINAVLNAGAIKWNDKYILVPRVEAADRKSFFAVAESPNGIDNFRFWEYPVMMPETDKPDTNIYGGVREVETLTYSKIVKSAFASPRSPVSHERLDELDQKLLGLLQADGRASYRAMATEVGASETVVRYRVGRMLERDVVRVTAVLRRSTDSAGMAMGIGLNVGGDVAAIADELAAMVQVDFVAVVSGRHDLLLTASAESLAELAAIADEVRTVPGVRRIRVWVHLQTYRESYRPGGFVESGRRPDSGVPATDVVSGWAP